MKVIYVDTPFGEDWETKTQIVKDGISLIGFLSKQHKKLSKENSGDYDGGFYVYDVSPAKEGNTLFIEYSIIKKVDRKMKSSDINIDDWHKYKNEEIPEKHKDSTPEQMQASINKLAEKFNRK
jgi:hypothetical protein